MLRRSYPQIQGQKTEKTVCWWTWLINVGYRSKLHVTNTWSMDKKTTNEWTDVKVQNIKCSLIFYMGHNNKLFLNVPATLKLFDKIISSMTLKKNTNTNKTVPILVPLKGYTFSSHVSSLLWLMVSKNSEICLMLWCNNGADISTLCV